MTLAAALGSALASRLRRFITPTTSLTKRRAGLSAASWLGYALLACTLLGCAAGNPLPQASEHYQLPGAQATNASTAGPPGTGANPVAIGVRAALIKTGSQSTRQALTIAGGSFFEPMQMNYIAVLIRHPGGDLLFDTGLGQQVDLQYQSAIPLWAKPFLRYIKSTPAVSQLQANGINTIGQIILSHAHWDHASGLADFPDAEVSLPAAEIDYIKIGKPPALIPAQFAHPGVKLKPLRFQDKRYGSFEQSLDWFGDGSVVLVPLHGHTPGSVGLILRSESGKRFMFVGDAIWNARALENGASKPWFVREIADTHAGETLRSLQRILDLQAANPGLEIVPAHDALIHDRIGYFPERWLP